MKAFPGDRIILAPPQVDGPTRDGEVLEARGPDGAPPYLVRWSDGHVGLLFPGPGSVLRIGHEHEEVAEARAPSAAQPHPTHPAAEAGASQSRHIRDWEVRITIFESENDTDAHVVLVADSPTHLSARGHSHRGGHDSAVPEIGDEVAVARALRHLADQLLDTAAEDIETVTGEEDIVLRPR
jgi:Rv2632c-like/Domain of unknown function (DUF1918)